MTVLSKIIGFVRTVLLITLGVAASAALAYILFSIGAGTSRSDGGIVPVSKSPVPAVPEPFDDEQPGKGKFLVASRGLTDPRFRETVVLLIDYNETGVMGLIVNRPTETSLAELFPTLPRLEGRADVVFYGGPLESRRMLLLIRSAKKPGESGRVFGNVYVSASRNTLERLIGSRTAEKNLRMYAGYAGWLPGQLDRELARGDWLIVRADARSIFDRKPADVWLELFRRGSAIQVRNRQRGSTSLRPAAVRPEGFSPIPALTRFHFSDILASM